MWERAAVLIVLCALSTIGNADPINELSQSLTWRRLLHYLPGAKISDVAEKDFYISPDGHRDPRGELAADIENLHFESQGKIEEKNRFSCRFPARARFIHKHFDIKPGPPCPRFEAWRNRAEPDAISFVHASQYTGNPSSAFGHSFIRFDRSRNSGLLGFSLSYFARTNPNDSSIAYGLKGLFGGYLGEYQFDQYYPKVHNYVGVDNRDLWEYELNLTQEERQMVFEHAWELSLAGRTPYYFLNRNCTYQLLRLVEIANDSYDLAAHASSIFLTPVDSIKILDRAGLIKKSTYRPSMQQQAQTKVDQLKPQQQRDLSRALSGGLAPESITDPRLASALVATLAMNEVSESNSQMKGLFSRAVEARSKLPITNFTSKESNERNPLNSHSSVQTQFGAFSQGGTGVLSLSVRPSLHSLDDFAAGFLPNTQLVFLNTEFRSTANNQVKLREFDLIDVKSFKPVTTISQGVSWTVHLAMEPMRATTKEGHQVRTAGSLGYSANLQQDWLGYALLGPTVDVVNAFGASDIRLGPSASLGTVGHASKNLIFRLEEKLDYFAVTPFDQEVILNTEAAASYHLTRDSSFSLTGSEKRNLTGDKSGDTELGLRFSENF